MRRLAPTSSARERSRVNVSPVLALAGLAAIGLLATRLPRPAWRRVASLDPLLEAGGPLVAVGLLLGPGIGFLSPALVRALAPVMALALGWIGAAHSTRRLAACRAVGHGRVRGGGPRRRAARPPRPDAGRRLDPPAAGGPRPGGRRGSIGTRGRHPRRPDPGARRVDRTAHRTGGGARDRCRRAGDQ